MVAIFVRALSVSVPLGTLVISEKVGGLVKPETESLAVQERLTSLALQALEGAAQLNVGGVRSIPTALS
jgi:hypothetical protein